MKFEEALEELEEGKKIRRSSWPKEEYIDLHKFYNERRKDANISDLICNDWEVMKDENNL